MTSLIDRYMERARRLYGLGNAELQLRGFIQKANYSLFDVIRLAQPSVNGKRSWQKRRRQHQAHSPDRFHMKRVSHKKNAW